MKEETLWWEDKPPEEKTCVASGEDVVVYQLPFEEQFEEEPCCA